MAKTQTQLSLIFLSCCLGAATASTDKPAYVTVAKQAKPSHSFLPFKPPAPLSAGFIIWGGLASPNVRENFDTNWEELKPEKQDKKSRKALEPA